MPRLGTGAALAAVLVASAAMAQDVSNAPPRTPAATPMPFDSTNAPAKPSYAARQEANQWLSSEFVGKDVYGPDRQKVGSISDLLLDKSGGVAAALIGVGGFLGIGEKEVAVPFGELQFSTQDGKRVITINATREALQSAPRFARAESPG